MNKLEKICRTIPEFTIDMSGSLRPSFLRQKIEGKTNSISPSEQQSGKAVKNTPREVRK